MHINHLYKSLLPLVFLILFFNFSIFADAKIMTGSEFLVIGKLD